MRHLLVIVPVAERAAATAAAAQWDPDGAAVTFEKLYRDTNGAEFYVCCTGASDPIADAIVEMAAAYFPNVDLVQIQSIGNLAAQVRREIQARGLAAAVTT